MVDVYVIVRQSPDWGSISYEEFQRQSREFCALMRRPPEQVNRSVDLWNNAFRRDYLQVRQAIKDLAHRNFAAINNVHLRTNLKAPPVIDENDLFVFIDDDDWLCPDLSSRLQTKDRANAAAVVWGSVSFGSFGGQPVFRRPLKEFCFTNNYAICGQYLVGRPERFLDVTQHVGANRAVKRSGSGYCLIKEYLSVTNKNPTSTVMMEKALQGDYSTASPLVQAVETFVSGCERIDQYAIDDLEWARPYMHGIRELFASLL